MEVLAASMVSSRHVCMGDLSLRPSDHRVQVVKNSWAITASFFLILLFATAARSASIYDVTFEEPVHQINSLPSAGARPDRISSINFGSPLVVSSMPLLTGNSLEFEGYTTYEQIELNLGDAVPGFAISFDLVTQNLLNSSYAFRLLLDTPEVRSLDFHGGLNDVRVFQPSGPSGSLQSFSDEQKYSIAMTIDLQGNLWTISIDDVQRFQNPINATQIADLRFSLSPWIGGAADQPSVKVFLDNINVSSIPEPNAVSLLIAGLVLCVILTHKRKLMP
jgi:hypothetical protein